MSELNAALTDILRRVNSYDPGLAGEIGSLFERSSKISGRRFGLVFEDSFREVTVVEGLAPQRGLGFFVKAVDGAVLDDQLYVVSGVADGMVSGVPAEGGDVVVFPEGRVVSVVYPGCEVQMGLRVNDTVGGVSESPHVLINGDNVYALDVLSDVLCESVDVIYVDPPYNTGTKTWKYSDVFVGDKDEWVHSRWLGFMRERLVRARGLLKDTGVIMVAIGDAEHHRLRMLLDQVFGEKNFVANLVWVGQGSYLSRFHSGGLDYMLVYAKNVKKTGKFREPKMFAEEVLGIGKLVVTEGVEPGVAEGRLREFLAKRKNVLPKGLAGYRRVDENGDVFCVTKMGNSLFRPNLVFEIVNPLTGVPYVTPVNGWICSQERYREWDAAGLIVHGGKRPVKKQFLREVMDGLPSPSFEVSRSRATKHLENVLGERRFPFPKDHEVLARWIRIVAPKDAVVLDFFAGSGSTGEAVSRLNADDGGSRRCVLVTNNEVSVREADVLSRAGLKPGDQGWEACGVAHHVTWPRLKTVVSGVRADGSVFGDGLPGGWVFADLVFTNVDKMGGLNSFRDLWDGVAEGR